MRTMVIFPGESTEDRGGKRSLQQSGKSNLAVSAVDKQGDDDHDCVDDLDDHDLDDLDDPDDHNDEDLDDFDDHDDHDLDDLDDHDLDDLDDHNDDDLDDHDDDLDSHDDEDLDDLDALDDHDDLDDLDGHDNEDANSQVGSVSPFSSHLYSPSSNSSQDPIAGKVSSQNLDFKLKPKPLPRFPSKVSCFRWDKKPSIRGERSKLLFPGSSHLFVLERPTFVIFERPPLIALLSLLQADTITMLHIPGEQISYSRLLLYWYLLLLQMNHLIVLI